MKLRQLRCILVLGAVATALLLPGSASATAPQAPRSCESYNRLLEEVPSNCYLPVTASYKAAPMNHVGWVYLELNYCPPNPTGCVGSFSANASSWRWTGSKWSEVMLPGGWVYVYPYSNPWRWAWTQNTGWVAIGAHVRYTFQLRSW